MASSPVAIVNSALLKLGHDPITSFDDETLESSLGSLLYDPQRKALLAEFDWSFARKRASLPALGDAPVWGYTTACQLPADFLRLLEVDGVRVGEINARVEGRTLVSNLGAPVDILYTWDIEDTTKFDVLFDEVLSDRLAGEMAYPVTKDMRYRRQFFEAAEYKLTQARTSDSQQDTAEVPRVDVLLRSRF